MRSRSFALGGLSSVLLLTGLAAAEVHGAPTPAAAAAPTGSATPGPNLATPLPDEPPKIVVDDPMLTPVPQPERTIASWDDAAVLLRARSTDLRRAYDDVRRAEADSRTALAAVLPTLNGTGTASHTILPKASGGSVTDTGGALVPTSGGGSNSLSGSLRLSLPLIDVQAWHQIGTAKLGEEGARLDYANLERTTAATLASAIAVNVTAERVSEIGRIGLRNALERLALTQAKERTGTATGLDIVRARQDVAQARSSLVTSDEALRKSRDALGLAVGIAEPIGVAPDTSLSSIGQSALKTCRPLPKLEDRADVLSAAKSVEIARRRAVEVDQGFLPTLSAGSTLTESVSDNNQAARTNWNVQAVLSVPIWDGGVRYGQRRNAAAVTDQNQAALEALKRDSTVDIVQANRAVTVADESRKVGQEVRDLALEVDRLTRAAYQTGKGTSLDLITSAEALRQAEVNLALDELALVQARITSLLTLADCSVKR